MHNIYAIINVELKKGNQLNMVVQNNLVAFRSAVFYKKPVTDESKLSSRLSSGNSISRSADDAAALEVSNRMRKQISGLNRESAEVQNSISLTQVAEEGLDKTGEILQRINELSIKAVDDEISIAERNKIHSEIRSLLVDLDNVANSTSFDDKVYPLRGDEGMNGTVADQVETEEYDEEPYDEEYVEARVSTPIKFIDASANGFDISSIEVATPEDAAFYNLKVENALNSVNTYKNVLGIVRSRLEGSILGTTKSAKEPSQKTVISEDSATDIVKDSLDNILKSSREAMMAQREKGSDDVLSLLEA